MTWKFFTPTIAPTIGTSLPASPVDGQEFVLVDSLSAPTWSWLLRYVAAKASNKWVFIGGPPVEAEVATAQTTASTTYAALTTPGPSIVIPVAGDYLVGHGFLATVSNTIMMSYDIGATGAVDADRITSNSNGSHARLKLKALTAVTLTSKYRVDAGTHTAEFRWISALPVAIGG